MNHVALNETNCVFKLGNKEFSNQGAYVDSACAHVYVKDLEVLNQIAVTDWKGNVLGYGRIKTQWSKNYSFRGVVRFRQVIFKINETTYSGRYSPDSGELVKAIKIWSTNESL